MSLSLNVNSLPYAASFFLFISFIPLVYRMVQTKSSEGVSFMMMVFGVIQSISFIIYDVYFERYSMVIPFTVLAFFFGGSLYLIRLYR